MKPTIVLAACLLAGAVAAPAAQAADTAPPALVAFDLTPATVDVTDADATVTVTAHVTDETGSQPPTLVFEHDGSAETAGFGAMTRASGTERDGVYTRTVVMPRGAAPGTWSATLYPLRDTLGNAGAFGPPPPFPRTLTVVSGTPADTDAPALTALAVTPGAVDAGAGPTTVTVTARLTDATGATAPVVALAAPGGATAGPSPMALAAGTPQDGTWTAALTIPRGGPAGAWVLELPALRDTLGNTAAPALPSGAPPVVTVRASAPAASGAAPAPPTGAPAALAPPDRTGPQVVLPPSSRRLRLGPGGRIRVAYGPAAEDSAGTLALRTRGRVRYRGRKRRLLIATADFRVAAGATATIRLNATPAGRIALRRVGHLRVVAALSVADAHGNATVRTFAATRRR